MGFHKIIASLDESELGQQVFCQALDLAQVYQSELHLLHVVPTLDPGMSTGADVFMGGLSDLGSYPIFANPELWEAQRQALQDHARAWLVQYVEQAHSTGVKVQWRCAVGEAGTAICEVAESLQADLVVIGRRGLSGLAEVFAGSVSNEVVHHAPCSVLVVQATPSEETLSPAVGSNP